LLGSAPVAQEGEAQPAAGFRLFVEGDEVGFDRSFGDVEIGGDFYRFKSSCIRGRRCCCGRLPPGSPVSVC